MTPIRELLSRIQWDKEFGKGNFIIGYYDRVEDKIIKVSLVMKLFLSTGTITLSGLWMGMALYRVFPCIGSGKFTKTIN